MESVLIRGRVGNFGTGVQLWRTLPHSLHTVSTVRSLPDTVLTLQGLTFVGDSHQEQESKCNTHSS